MICPNCGTDNPPGAHFCINCGQPLPRVCPNCGTVNPPAARFCMQCGTPLAPAAPPAQNSSAPAPVRGPTGATGPSTRSEERRVVTVVFADLVNSTVLADTMDPEELRALLAAYFARMTQAIHLHGGTVEKYVGDAVMAVFGLPSAHEDDPVRAVRAALDMRRALHEFNRERRAADPAAPELSMHLGVNTGEVMAAIGADATEGEDFLITGDAVNVAARLQQLAEPDAILVGPRTNRATRGAVTYRALPAIAVRGKPRPLRVWEALAMVDTSAVPTARPRGVEGLRAPLVGRDVEMSLLWAFYRRSVAERHAHLVTVLGIPGIGKTRLVREFISQLLGASPVAGPDAQAAPDAETAERPLVLEGRCPPYGEGITFWPLAEMLRAYVGFGALDPADEARAKILARVTALLAEAGRADDPVALAAYLGHTIGIETPERRQSLLPAEGRALQEGLFRAWRTFFESLAASRPLVILIDDIHWADDPLLDLLEALAARSHEVPLLLLCPARPELLERRPTWGEGQRNAVTLALEPLPEQDAARLVDALLPGDSIPATLRRGILDKAGGNPFYVEEIIRMLTDRGILYRETPREATAGPEGRDESAPGLANSGRWRIAPAWEGSVEISDPVIPDTVQGVLAARLDLLPHDERLILQHAAIIGRYFWLGALAGLAPEVSRDSLELGLEALQRKDLIQEGGPGSDLASFDERLYTFKHALTREVTYAAIPRARRALEHARLAEWLETQLAGGEARVELLAHHFLEYYRQADLARSRNAVRRQVVRAKVIAYLLRAGDGAAARHVAAKAERYYTDAWELLQEEPSPATLPTRVNVLMRRGLVRWLQAKGDIAWADYRAALELWLETGVVDAVTGHAFEAEQAAADLVEDLDVYGGAAGDVANLDPGTWAKTGLHLYRQLVVLPTRSASWFTTPPPHEELREYLERGLALADMLGLRDSIEGAALLTAKCFFWWSWPEKRGEAELLDALRGAREAVRISERLGDANAASEALDALGNMQSTTADLRGHLESQTRRLFWARQIEEVTELVDIQAAVSTAYQLVGEFELAVAHAHESLELARSVDTPALQAQALRAEVLAYFEWDRWSEAIHAGQQLIDLSAGASLQSTPHHRLALLSLAVAYTRMGQDDEAERMVALVREESRSPDIQYVSVIRARLALAHGAENEGERLLLAALDARSGRSAMPQVLSELAELGARKQRTLFDRFGVQAVEMGWRSGARKPLAQAIRARGMMSLAEGRWDDANADLHDALNRFRALGTRLEQARTLYTLAGLARSERASERAQSERAEDDLRQALSLFEALGAARDVARVRLALAGDEVRFA